MAWSRAEAARRAAVGALVGVVLAGYAGTVACGRADNGDFMKIAMGYAEKPSGFSSAWPPPSSPEGRRRLFAAWLPKWDARADGRLSPGASKRSSGHLLWFPGALVARAIGGDTLDLRWVGLPARVAAAAFAVLSVFLLARAGSLGVLAAALFAAVAIDVGYLSFLNTWYEEGPSLPYALALFAGLLAWAHGRRRLGFVAVVAAVIALTTARSVNWAFGIVFVVLAFVWRRRLPAPAITPGVRAMAGALLVLASVASAVVVARYPEHPLVNPFNALFYGALTFVDDPHPHLARLGFGPEARRFVGNPIFVGDAHAFAYAHPALIDFTSVLAVYAREPAAVGRALWFAIGRLHDTRLAYLPLHAEHARAGFAELDVRQRVMMRLHGWPIASAVWLAGLAAAGAMLARGARDPAWGIVVLALLGCALAGTVTAILGDGRQEIEKHLWTANLLLDLAACAVVAGGSARRAPAPAPHA
ncbi:MAG: hypothetical protein IT294_04300 [Deltaproteobacteria bacterium]|nr:hypothetical protein [Deltaproteobacteria bacterium]